MADLRGQPVKQVLDVFGQSSGMVNEGLAKPLVFPVVPTNHQQGPFMNRPYNTWTMAKRIPAGAIHELPLQHIEDSKNNRIVVGAIHESPLHGVSRKELALFLVPVPPSAPQWVNSSNIPY